MDIDWIIDSGYLPSAVIRYGIRQQLRERIRQIDTATQEDAIQRKLDFVRKTSEKAIAIETDAANQQHYEVGAGVLQACLGPRMKYSSCLYPTGKETLGQAELEMLRLYVDRAQIKDGMRILDLGCGWGSASLFLAETFPRAHVVALSNSASQKAFIDQRAAELNLANLTVITANVVNHEFEPNSFDRVISIELFEHMKNYELLMAKIAGALKPTGKLFVHIFSHASQPYDFEDGWMSKHFFTGGTMPSTDLLLYFQKDLRIEDQWFVSGLHYGQTCEDWLSRMNENKMTIWPHLQATYGEGTARTWFYRWQVFYMACAELFSFGGGNVWGVSHYLFSKS